MSNPRLLAWMFQFLRPVKWMVVLICLYLAVAVGAEVLVTRQSGAAINYLQSLYERGFKSTTQHFWPWVTGNGPRARELRLIIGKLAVCIGALFLLRYLRVVSEAKMSMQNVYYIREAVYDKLQRVGFGFHDAVSSGQLINRSLGDLNNVRVFVQTAVLSSLEILLVIAGYITLILTRSPWVALLALAPIPIWTVYILWFSRRVQPVAKSVMEAEDKNVSILTENIAGVHVVKAFATEQQEIRKYNDNCDLFLERVRKRIRLFANFTPFMRLIAIGSILTLFLVAGIFMIKGRLSAGDFLILGGAMNAILGRLQGVATINEQYQNAIVSARRLYEVLMAPATVPESPSARPLPPGPGSVRFEHVAFGYDRSKPVVHGVDFEVKGGSIVAIVGPTGAGKSTLMNLVARFYDPSEGRVLIDGMDVRDATLNSLRTQISFVFQETYLFSDTVSGNIAYGRPHITGGEIEAAARLAQGHEFIEELPQKYETLLGERGASLSGGQRQRLAIARAILTNPRILILDDATASVDSETEDLIRKAMRFVMQGRTTFVIAHRISTVKQADLVLVVESGRITQMGTHAKLMAEEGHYRDIAAVQLYGDEPHEGDRPSHMDRVRDRSQVAVAAAAAGRGTEDPGPGEQM